VPSEAVSTCPGASWTVRFCEPGVGLTDHRFGIPEISFAGGYHYHIDYSAVARKSRCVAGNSKYRLQYQ